jgi:hypothetical protein
LSWFPEFADLHNSSLNSVKRKNDSGNGDRKLIEQLKEPEVKVARILIATFTECKQNFLLQRSGHSQTAQRPDLG